MQLQLGLHEYRNGKGTTPLQDAAAETDTAIATFLR